MADEDQKEKFEAIITFLKKTKDGEYATVDEYSFPYTRMAVEDIEDEGNFVYSLE